MDRITTHHQFGRTKALRYRVKMGLGWGPEHDTWERREHLEDKSALADYEETHVLN